MLKIFALFLAVCGLGGCVLGRPDPNTEHQAQSRIIEGSGAVVECKYNIGCRRVM